MTVNKAILIGRLGADPEMRSTQSGTSVVNMRMATNRSWTDDTGQRQEDTEWHRVVVFGGQAEACNQYLSKGRQVYVEGRIQTREWQDDSGDTRYTTEVVAQTVQFLDGGSDAPTGGSGGPPPASEPSGFGQGGGGGGGNGDDYSDEPFDDDDIPF